MKRKLVEQGKVTLMVSLPVEWIRKFNLKKGDEIELKEEDENIVISSQQKESKKAIIQLQEGRTTHISHIIKRFYISGYDQLELNFSSQDVRKCIEEALKECIGYEIVNTGENFCIIKSVAEIADTDFEDVLKRLFAVTLRISANILSVLKEKELELLKDPGETLEKTVNKLSNFCMRLLAKKSYGERSIFLYMLISNLEQIADEFNNLRLALLRQKKFQISKKILNFYEGGNSFLNKLFECFCNPYNEEEFIKIHDIRHDLVMKGYDLLYSSSKEEAIIVHYILTIILKFLEIKQNFIGLKI